MADEPSRQQEESGRGQCSSKNGPSEGKIRSRHIEVPSTTRPESAVDISVKPGDVVTLKAKAGALIGSFDDFVRSFVVGSSTSIQVPKRADSLALAVNDNADASDQPRDDDLVVEVFTNRKGKGSAGRS